MDIPLVSYISCIMSRLAYFDNDLFLEKYSEIFGNTSIQNQLPILKKTNISTIFKPIVKDLLKINNEVNKINYANKKYTISSKDVKYICISNSNYSSVYIVADKRTNCIFVSFRGTSSVKSALSYTKLTSISAYNTCSKNENGYLLGVFKIVTEIFYTIEESIHFLSTSFLKIKNPKIITTGHSLGGGCATIFSYLWVSYKKTDMKIVCNTFGSPRVMNAGTMEKYTKLIQDKKIMFRRFITNGDPFTKLPPNNIKTLKNNKTFYHPDDYDANIDYTSISCINQDKIKKVICDIKNKTKKRKIHLKYHALYLGVSYKHAAQGLTNLKKEIIRNTNGDTIGRIIVGGDNSPFKVSFFNFESVKHKDFGFIKRNTRKIAKLFITDYKHPDIYMNKTNFKNIIDNGLIMNDDELNPLNTGIYVPINNKVSVKPPLICV